MYATCIALLHTKAVEKGEKVRREKRKEENTKGEMEVIRIVFAFLLVLECTSGSSPQPDFYSVSCPGVEPIVQAAVLKAMQNDSRIAASLVRLFFHDCFVQGCDASILLDDAPSIISEKHAPPNANSVRGFELIDSIKADLERLCPVTLSCADILALAARDATSLSDGPFWPIPLGCRDGTNANLSLANIALPGPSFNLSRIIFLFATQGLNEVDLVALSGVHTFGRAKCIFFKHWLYNFTGDGKAGPNMEEAFKDKLRLICPEGGNPNTLAELDHSTPNGFDNEYFKEHMRSQGLRSIVTKSCFLSQVHPPRVLCKGLLRAKPYSSNNLH